MSEGQGWKRYKGHHLYVHRKSWYIYTLYELMSLIIHTNKKNSAHIHTCIKYRRNYIDIWELTYRDCFWPKWCEKGELVDFHCCVWLFPLTFLAESAGLLSECMWIHVMIHSKIKPSCRWKCFIAKRWVITANKSARVISQLHAWG